MLNTSPLGKYIPEISAVVLLSVVALAIAAANSFERQAEWVAHTLQTQSTIGELESALLEAQSGNRGFLLTGDEEYLTPYHAALKTIDERQKQLATLIADNPAQVTRLKNMTQIVSERLEILKRGIAERRRSGLQAGVAFISTHKGMRLMQAIRDHLREMRETEAALLTQRRMAQASAGRKLSLIAGLGLLIAAFASGIWISASRRFTRQLQQTITARDTAEAQLRQAQKMEAIGQLTGGIAHDFNNMLAVIISALTLMQKRLAAGDTNVQKFLDGATDAANRAAALTKRLLAFARQQPLQPQPVNANKLVSNMSEILTRSLGETINLESVTAAGLWNAYIDPHQLENALLNLAVNARDAMPDGGKLTIETENVHMDERYAERHGVDAGQYVMIALTDTGTGMTADVAARVFEPFYTTKPVGKGTGLGLSQVHGFVRQSGGHVKIYSEPGQGTTVKVYLPRHRGTETPSQRSQIAEPSISREQARGVTILAVEDDPTVRQSTVAMIEELGYRVIEADGAETALAQLQAHPEISLLFTDIVMPQTNGRKLADEALRRRPDLQVLFTTGFTRNAIVHHGRLDPDVNLITKPFSLNELALKIQPIIAASKKASVTT